jgi:methyl-accepting chemotaxis protein
LLVHVAGLLFGPIPPLVAAVLASLLSVAAVLAFGRGPAADDGQQFIAVVGHAIDDIMIGAAETSYFVDSVKKKIEKDVQTAVSVVASAEEVAASTARIAGNAERAAEVAARVRSESVAGRAEVDQGLARISSARAEADQAAATMIALQEKSKAIAGFTQVIS